MKRIFFGMVTLTLLFVSCDREEIVSSNYVEPRRVGQRGESCELYQNVKISEELQMSPAEMAEEIARITKDEVTVDDINLSYLSAERLLSVLSLWTGAVGTKQEFDKATLSNSVIPKNPLVLCNLKNKKGFFLLNTNRVSKYRIISSSIAHTMRMDQLESILVAIPKIVEEMPVDEITMVEDIPYEDVEKLIDMYPDFRKDILGQYEDSIDFFEHLAKEQPFLFNSKEFAFHHTAQRILPTDVLSLINLTSFRENLHEMICEDEMGNTNNGCFLPYWLFTSYTEWIDSNMNWTQSNPFPTITGSLPLAVAKFLAYEKYMGTIDNITPFRGADYYLKKSLDELNSNINIIKKMTIFPFSKHFKRYDELRAYLILRRCLGSKMKLILHPTEKDVWNSLENNHVVIAIKNHEAIIIYGLCHSIHGLSFYIDINSVDNFNFTTQSLNLDNYILIVYEE